MKNKGFSFYKKQVMNFKTKKIIMKNKNKIVLKDKVGILKMVVTAKNCQKP